MASARRWAPSRFSIVRLLSLCVVLAGAAQATAEEAGLERKPALPPYSAWQGQTPVAPPSPIVLRAPPPPELAPLEYTRRPFEIAPEFLLGLPSCSDGSADNTRCAGLGAGAGLGLSAFWRPSPYFAFGATVNALGFVFNPPPASQLSESHAGGLFYGLLGRVYFADHGPVEPYVELGLGGGADRTSAREASDVKYTDTAGGVAFRAGGAVEFYLSRQLRLGPALDWTHFRVRSLQHCDEAQACVDLDSDRNGHGVGFTTLSVRLTLSIGPGL